MKAVSEILQNYQHSHKLTQHQMSEMLGISQPTYNNWINKKTHIDQKHYPTISKLCNLPIETLIPPNTKIYFSNSKNELSEAHDAVSVYKKYTENLEESLRTIKAENAQLKEANENQARTIVELQAGFVNAPNL